MADDQFELKHITAEGDGMMYGMAIADFVINERANKKDSKYMMYAEVYEKKHTFRKLNASINEIIRWGYCWVVQEKGKIASGLVAIGIFIPPNESKRALEMGDVDMSANHTRRFEQVLKFQEIAEVGEDSYLAKYPLDFEASWKRFWRKYS